MQKVFSVFDCQVEAFITPFFFPATGAGIRAFTMAANDGSHAFNKHAGDYTLFELGSFDEKTGQFIAHTSHVNLGTALTFIEGDGPGTAPQARFPNPELTSSLT